MCLGRPTEATGRGETWLGRQTEATGGGETGKTGGKEGKTGGEKGTGGVAAGSSAGSAKCCGGRSPGSGISGTHWAAGSSTGNLRVAVAGGLPGRSRGGGCG